MHSSAGRAFSIRRRTSAGKQRVFSTINSTFLPNLCLLPQSDVSVESVPYTSPTASKVGVYLAENFDNPSLLDTKWIKSNSKKPDVDEELAQYDGKLLIILYISINVLLFFYTRIEFVVNIKLIYLRLLK